MEKNKLSEECYKNLNKHTECTKCFDKITRDNYKKDRSICRKCYSKYMLEYNLNRRGEYNKLNSSNNFDSSNKLDSSNKQESSRKQVRSRKQDNSNKQDVSSNYIIDVDLNLLCDKLREIYSKPNMIDSDYTMSKMILDELLRTKSLPKRQHNALCKQIG